MDILKTIPKWIKRVFDDPKLLLTLVVTSLFLLFAPPNWLRILGIDLVAAEYRGIIALVCLFAGASFFATVSSSIIDSFAARQVEKDSQNEDIKKAENLTDDEQAIVLEFICNQLLMMIDKFSANEAMLEIAVNSASEMITFSYAGELVKLFYLLHTLIK